jgi:hypothetical protein
MEAHKGGKDLESVRGFEVLCGFGFSPWFYWISFGLEIWQAKALLIYII